MRRNGSLHGAVAKGGERRSPVRIEMLYNDDAERGVL